MRILVLVFVFSILAGCVTASAKKQPRTIEGKSGRAIPLYSLSISADYDPRLDSVMEGYKLLPVMIRNLSLRPISMSAESDRWVVVGEKGKKYRAVNSLRLENPVVWREMPDKLRTMIDYPEVVPINYSVTFDLLLPREAVLDYFREIRYLNAASGKEFRIKKEY